MLRIKRITEVIGKKVYTDTGDIFGEVEEANLIENKIEGWKVRVPSSIGSFLGGAKGAIIPHQFVKAIGDIMIISKAHLPLEEESEFDEKIEEDIEKLENL